MFGTKKRKKLKKFFSQVGLTAGKKFKKNYSLHLGQNEKFYFLHFLTFFAKFELNLVETFTVACDLYLLQFDVHIFY